MEISVNPKAPFPTVIAFDGRVLEFFFADQDMGSIRFHITHITAVQFASDKKGRQMLEFKTKSGRPIVMEVAPQEAGAVKNLVATLKQAMAGQP
jgi:hypothetical protein